MHILVLSRDKLSSSNEGWELMVSSETFFEYN